MGSEENNVDTEWYRFNIQERDPECVQIVAVPRIREAAEEDVKYIQEFLGHLGKWERLVSSIRALLCALGFGSKLAAIDYAFGSERYEIDLKIENVRGIGKIVAGSIMLRSEESKRRARTGNCYLPATEVACQIENIPKWTDWRDSVLLSLRG